MWLGTISFFNKATVYNHNAILYLIKRSCSNSNFAISALLKQPLNSYQGRSTVEFTKTEINRSNWTANAIKCKHKSTIFSPWFSMYTVQVTRLLKSRRASEYEIFAALNPNSLVNLALMLLQLRMMLRHISDPMWWGMFVLSILHWYCNLYI